ncbi:LysR family transcriptional regulator [Labedaea rhizosphaerae]|uniref:DNA-binding transcriptional LysR family regulator n=1 Tax=Labedaea rhizosphaerae TaxID=598644 RepID=A0A4R6SH91_LABRH|nr:LysR family transcriptional regulator [Labedaea rhizosphaerae]TDQ01165.1 DNA-binding transcriptional LysR family regulator [Labedaea rhizosphaerae]
MDDLEVRELRYFLAVADELNFTRAAQRLGIAQPPLSKAIRAIEHRLGVQLFTRSTRKVELTEAGRVLAEHARPVLLGVAAAVARTRRAAAADPALLVAIKPGTGGDLLRDIICRYSLDPGLPPAEVVIGGWAEQAQMVRDGRADVALIGGPFCAVGLDIEPLHSEPRMAALSARHRLANRTGLLRSDLDGEAIPLWPDAEPDSDLARYWSGTDRHPDIKTKPGPVITDMTQLLEVVAFGQGVAFLPASVRDAYPDRGVVFVPVADLSPATLYLGWAQSSSSRAVAAFVRAAQDVTADEDVLVEAVRS